MERTESGREVGVLEKNTSVRQEGGWGSETERFQEIKGETIKR